MGPYFKWAGAAALVVYWLWSGVPATSDADNFWRVAPLDPYTEPWGGPNAYVYSPAFAQLISPLTVLPWEVFYKVWQGIALVALAWLLSPAGAVMALLLPFVRADVNGGQIHLWMAAFIASQHPSAWPFGLLTKVTPGIGLLWYIARREWHRLGVALAATVLIVAISAAVDPRAWFDWIGLLAESSTMHMSNIAVSQLPVVLRLPIAAGLMVMAAWRDRPAAIPVIVCFALPAIWPSSFALLAAVPRLMRASKDGRQRKPREAATSNE